ncbi:MAG: hypothetical protein QXY62_02085 [Candidatus Altiarchaeota archaeon]
MESKKEQIKKILKEDLLRFEDIYACAVSAKHLGEGIGPFTKPEHESELRSIWDSLEKTTDEFFRIIENYSNYGLGEVYFRLQEYEVMFFVLPETDTALVAIIPALANKGLLEVAMEKARRKIIKIMKD